MAYRYGDRYHRTLFPKSIEEYVSPDDPVRAYDALVSAIGRSAKDFWRNTFECFASY